MTDGRNAVFYMVVESIMNTLRDWCVRCMKEMYEKCYINMYENYFENEKNVK